MKAFLSHSSKDKGYVEEVASLMRPGSYELDSETFDAGLLNSQAIIQALRRADLFCLFLSSNSVQSAYVEFELLLGLEFIASGKIAKFLAVCLDEEAFSQASANAKFFNIVRKRLTPESAVRLIEGTLISTGKADEIGFNPFLGREKELLELERQISDHSRPAAKALFISGNHGSGRKSLAKAFYQTQFPRSGKMIPEIKIDDFTGIHELYRNILSTLRPTLTAKELRSRIQAFELVNLDEQRRQTADLLNALLPAQEAAFLVDNGGILTDSGSLTDEINGLISKLATRPHPPAIIIAPRMIPSKFRRQENDLAYVGVRSLSYEATKRLLSRLTKDKDIILSDEAMDELIKLSDGHPFNIYRLIQEIEERGALSFLSSPSDFLDWKHRQSSEYLAKLYLTELDIQILALLRSVPELDFSAIVSALSVDAETTSDALSKLSHLHVVDGTADRFQISPALRVAVERDRRIKLPKAVEQNAMRNIANSLSVRLEEGTASISLVNTAIIASLDSSENLSGFAAAFLLPSHYVWMAKRYYDQKSWEDSIRHAREGLKGAARLSIEGVVAACRYLCLPGARIGDADAFDEGMSKLEAINTTNWVGSNVAFLKGFQARLKGLLPKAEPLFRRAYELSPGNTSAARELASICLARDNLDEAERFAREAFGQAQRNPYVVDIFLAVLIRKHGRNAKRVSEINEMFDVLEKVGEEGGKSFYTTRRAEFEHLWGSNKEALRLIELAIKKTPRLFEPQRIYAEILLKDGNKIRASSVIDGMREMVNARDVEDSRTNYRAYLVTYSHYLIEIGEWEQAKNVYEDINIFSDKEREAAIKEIEVTQGYSSRR
ncbi:MULTISPECIES: toll/interleukin-1 receptor domain-containing protein [unclassified Agrobacterium]|uniref:toll/interleukin-1 receptor domain-containing protein n=1 Tax=unclassified Agrobacterium TaxID=2632611 RepID=UPI00037A83DF|nr:MULTISPECIES: toll/interleukin-1 receptor domain-containing protein [unclassified Agrobacterium]SNB83255.1 Tetratricopeptide repeat-containing protein [Agrobacterium sp. 719_389]